MYYYQLFLLNFLKRMLGVCKEQLIFQLNKYKDLRSTVILIVCHAHEVVKERFERLTCLITKNAGQLGVDILIFFILRPFVYLNYISFFAF